MVSPGLSLSWEHRVILQDAHCVGENYGFVGKLVTPLAGWPWDGGIGKGLAQMGSRGTVGVGIVGTGARGVSCLGRRMAELASETGLRVAALCDRRPDRLREARDFLIAEHARHV